MQFKLSQTVLKISHISAILLGSLSLASHALATETKAETTVEKSASKIGPVNAYSNFRLSHYVEGKKESEASDKLVASPRARFQPTLGVKLFNDQLDAYVVGYFDRMENTPTLEQHKQARVYLEHAGWSLGDFKIAPYIRHDLALKNSGAVTRFASVQSYSHVFSTNFGALTPKAGVELGTFLYNKAPEAEYTVDNHDDMAGLGLRSEGDVIKGKKKDQDFYHEWFAELALVPSFNRDFSVSMITLITNNHTPTYHVNADKKEESSYALTTETTERLRVAYAINEQFTVRNDYYAIQKGMFKELNAPGAPSVINELQLIYTLF